MDYRTLVILFLKKFYSFGCTHEEMDTAESMRNASPELFDVIINTYNEAVINHCER